MTENERELARIVRDLEVSIGQAIQNAIMDELSARMLLVDILTPPEYNKKRVVTFAIVSCLGKAFGWIGEDPEELLREFGPSILDIARQTKKDLEERKARGEDNE